MSPTYRRAVSGIDPVSAYLGSEIDSHKITDVRAALLPLEQFAAQLDVAVLCIAHPPKAPSAKALNFIAGSGAFTHAPRLAFMAIEDPESPGRNLLLAVKNSLGRKADGLGYSIASAFVGPDESILTSRIEWDNRPVYMTADEVLRAHAEKNKAKAKDEAEDFLRTKMEPGQSYPAGDIEKDAAVSSWPCCGRPTTDSCIVAVALSVPIQTEKTSKWPGSQAA
jgi:hypothetical protein